MIRVEDRRSIACDIEKACNDGAGYEPACQLAGISLRTLQRWKSGAEVGVIQGDGRPGAMRPAPAHALSDDERRQIISIANESRFAAMPPARIVPMLADEGVYLASESSFSRVLRAHGQTRHRGRAKVPHAVRPPTTHIATAPAQVWCWDMTYLPTGIIGRWFYLYLIWTCTAERSWDGRCMRPTTPIMRRCWLNVLRSLRGFMRCQSSQCFMVTTAPRSKQRPCCPCSTGWASSRLTRALVSAMITLTPSRCFARRSIGLSSLTRALPIYRKPAVGVLTLPIGTTMTIGIAGLVMSVRRSATTERIAQFWRPGMICMSAHEK